MALKSEILKSLRMVLGKRSASENELKVDLPGQVGSDRIRSLLLSNDPCMIGRFGSNELDLTLRVYERSRHKFMARPLRYVRGEIYDFWWDRGIRKRMSLNAGFFPTDNQSMVRFGERMLADIPELDVMGIWNREEWRLRHLFPDAGLMKLIELEPFRHRDPWSEALSGKKVLVVHPFEDSIRKQYSRRELLFEDVRTLPRFELLTLKSVVSNAMNDVKFASWFDALDHMQGQISDLDFDIAIIGCGAYGLPLAAFVKRMGKKAIHLGGATQLLFGLKGRRWDSSYQHIYNQHWVRPLDSESPARPDLVEGNAYW